MTEETVALLESLERQLLDASVRGDPVAVDRMLSDDFMEFGSSGNIYDKAMVIVSLSAEREGPAIGRTIEDLSVRLLSEGAALLTYVAVRHLAGDASRRKTLRSSIWRLSPEGIWRMTFHQGTISA